MNRRMTARVIVATALGFAAVALSAVAQTAPPTPVPSQTPVASPVASDDAIRKILADRIDAQHQSVGIVVGVVSAEGRRVVAYGQLEKGDPRPLDGDTLFEIGSMTKVFTSLLLADMVHRGEVSLEDPVSKYLPPNVMVPQHNGRSITLIDLATHTSGLPRLPTNMTPKDPANPSADYSVDQLYGFLSGYQLARDVGAQYEYSNLGVALLGHALTRRTGVDYEALVKSRISGPLGMSSTAIALTPAMKARFAVGHDASMATVENWDLPTLAGAGALRSTANDMLTFLSANLGYTQSPLAPAMASMLAVRRPTDIPATQIALGWHITTHNGREIVWHNGGTGGYRSYMGYDRKAGIGVVVLSNASTDVGIDDIGQHLLDPGVPLHKPPTPHKQVAVDPKIFNGYVGTYQLAPNFFIVVTHEGDHLLTQVTNQPKFEIFPESDRDYFLKDFDAQLTFVTDSQGVATSLVLHQGGADHPAARVGGPPPPPAEHKEIAVDPKIFDEYVGSYELAPSFVIAITREGNQLFLQATGQPKFEIFPESPASFFLKAVDAQITFVVDGQGKANSLVLHQNGANQSAKRVEGTSPPQHKEVAVDAKLFDGYVGRYELAPNFILTVTREGGHLMTQATGQPKAEIFPESPTNFFLKVADAQITFVVDAQGKATSLVLHQGGADHPGKRVE